MSTSPSSTDIEPKSLYRLAYDKIRADVLGGQLLPGLRLRLNDVCARYDVGTTPAREALSRLASEGLLIHTEQRGFVVARIDREELIELTRTRCWVEERAISESIDRGDAAWEERIVLAQHRLARIPFDPASQTAEVRLRWEAQHNELHEAFIAACGSRWMIDFCRLLRDLAYRYRQVSAYYHSHQRKAEHSGIIEACLGRDKELAATLLKEHYWRTTNLTLRGLNMDPPSNAEAGFDIDRLEF